MKLEEILKEINDKCETAKIKDEDIEIVLKKRELANKAKKKA